MRALFISKPLFRNFLAAMVIPFSQPQDWVELKYRNTPKNKITYGEKLTIQVKSSAGPLAYKFPEPISVKSFRISYGLEGAPPNEKGFGEDSVMRLGFIAVGENKLGGLKSWFVADWVKTLFSLAPKNLGLDKVYFYKVNSDPNSLDQQRIHPLSEYLWEKNIYSQVKASPETGLSQDLSFNSPVIGLWISVDGDDTKSEYTTIISNLALDLKDK